MKTPEQVKYELAEDGISVAEWSREHGFKAPLVYQILSGRSKARRGASFKIAKALGLREWYRRVQ